MVLHYFRIVALGRLFLILYVALNLLGEILVYLCDALVVLLIAIKLGAVLPVEPRLPVLGALDCLLDPLLGGGVSSCL